MPYFSGDKGTHVYDRFLIQSCTNVIPEEKRDKQLLDKLKAESEYLVCASIKALQNFIARGYVFTESKRTKKNREEYAMRNNSLALFLNDCCDNFGIGTTPTRIFKEKYLYWCRENRLTPEKPNNISKILVEKHGIEKFKSNTDCYRLTIKNF